MRLAVVCNQDDEWEAKRIYDEANAIGIDVELCNYDCFSVKIVESKVNILYRDALWNIPDIGIFRSSNYNKKKIKFEELAYILRDTIIDSGGKVFNYTGINIGTFGKLRQQYALAKSGFAHIDSFYGLENAPYFPIVIKPLHGSSGDGVQMINDQSRKIETTDTLMQKVMQKGRDYRVMILKGEALGAIERTALKDVFVANVSKGASARTILLDREVLQIAVDVAKLFGLEYAGVDLIKDDDDHWHVLEINRFAQFQGFEKATGINVAKKILESLLKEKS